MGWNAGTSAQMQRDHALANRLDAENGFAKRRAAKEQRRALARAVDEQQQARDSELVPPAVEKATAVMPSQVADIVDGVDEEDPNPTVASPLKHRRMFARMNTTDLTSDSEDDDATSAGDKKKTPSKKISAEQQISEMLGLSSDEEELFFHNGSKTMLAGLPNPKKTPGKRDSRKKKAPPSPRKTPADDAPVFEPGECEVLLNQVRMTNENHVPMLLAMALGLKSNHYDPNSRPLANFENDTTDIWKQLPKASIPKVPQLKNEMKRRASQRGIKLRKNTAPKAECIKWLEENPVVDPVDRAFLQEEEAVLYQALIEAAVEHEDEQRAKLLTANWVGNKPWLRLYCCMVSDEAMTALKRKDEVLDREQLDARNNAERPETHVEVVCRCFNDPEKVFFTEILPELHEDFSEVIRLDFNEMPGGALKPEECKKKMTECRAKLMQVSVAYRLRINR